MRALSAPALVCAVLALLGWLAMAVAAPGPALQGWWTAFVFVSGPPLGAVALLLIRRLVGGEWGRAFAPELKPAARAAPLLILLALPCLIAPGLVWRWAADPSVVEAQVRGVYLNPVAFAVRTLAILCGLGLIAWRLPALEGPRGRLGAGLALVVYGVAVSFAAVDWVLSLQPSYTSSAAGMVLATQQLAAALAFAALQGAHRPARNPAGDLGALLFATLLGLLYLAFMSYLVVWYGDRPEPDRWYLLRRRTPWAAAALTALTVGFAAPTLLLAVRHRLGTRRALFWAGACALLGLLAWTVWQVGAAFGAAALAPAALAGVAQGGLLLAVAAAPRRLGLRPREAAHAG